MRTGAVSEVMVAASYGSPGGNGGSPMGPLEKIQTGRARSWSAKWVAYCRAGSSHLPAC